MGVVCLKYMALGSGAGELNDTTLPSVYGLTPPVNYTPTDTYVHGQLEGIDNAIGALVGGSLVLSGAANPNGVVTAAFVGQVYVNTATLTQWVAAAATNADWYQQVNPARSGAGSPIVGALVPRHLGELYINTNDNTIWYSYGALNTNWRQSTAVAQGVVTPYGAVVPEFVGQVYVDTVLGRVWLAHGATNSDWSLVVKREAGGLLVHETMTVPDGTGNIILGGGGPQVFSLNSNAALVGGDGGSVQSSDQAVALGGTSVDIDNAENAIAGGNAAVANQTNSLVVGDAAAAYRGDGTSAGAVALGTGSTVYGNAAAALNGGKTYGTRALAVGEAALALGARALAVGMAGVEDAEVSGAAAVGVGHGVQVHGDQSGAIGLDVQIGSVVTKAVTITNVGPDVELVVAGEDLTGRIAGGDKLILYALSGGGHNNRTDLNVHQMTVGAIAFALGDTTITVSGVNVSPATAGRVAFNQQAQRSFAFGKDVIVHTGAHHSLAGGEGSQVEGEYQVALGFEALAGVAVTDTAACAIGYQTKAVMSYSQAFGRNAQTRNKGEFARAGQQWSGVEWSQTRQVDVHRDALVAAGVVPMYTDAVDAGTEEIETFVGHAYAVEAMVMGIIDSGAGTRLTAAWLLQALFRNEAGTVTQVGATITTLIANDDGARFDTTPVFAVTGSNIRINVADDGTGVATVRWMGAVRMVELGT